MRADPRRVTLVCTILLLSACSPSLKTQAVRQVQALDTVLSTVQDSEISLYASGLVPGLTDERHRQFHGHLVTAFEAEERLALTLRAWQPGDPMPTDVLSVLSAAEQAVALLEDVVPEGNRLWSPLRAWLETAISLQRLLGGGA